MDNKTTHKRLLALIESQKRGNELLPLEEIVEKTEGRMNDIVLLRKIALARYGSPWQRFFYGLAVHLHPEASDIGAIAKSQYQAMKDLSQMAHMLYNKLEEAYHRIIEVRDKKLKTPVEIYERLRSLRQRMDELMPEFDKVKNELDATSAEENPEDYARKDMERVKIQREISEIMAEYEVKNTAVSMMSDGSNEMGDLENYALNSLVLVGKLCAFLDENTDRLGAYSSNVVVFEKAGTLLNHTLELVEKITNDNRDVMQSIHKKMMSLPRDYRPEDMLSLTRNSYPKLK